MSASDGGKIEEVEQGWPTQNGFWATFKNSKYRKIPEFQSKIRPPKFLHMRLAVHGLVTLEIKKLTAIFNFI
jgi:hypothetical protein